MKDGFYAASFTSQFGYGSGVVFLEDGIFRGGDSVIYFLGNYAVEGDAFTGEMTTNRHHFGSSMFGRDVVHLKVSGTFAGTDATLTGTTADTPPLTLRITLKRIGD